MSGAVVDVASWGDHVPLPAESPWPNRRFAVAGNRLLVQDLPAESVVAASLSADGAITVDVNSTFPERGGVYRRLWTAPPTRDGELDSRWQFRSYLDRIFWSADVSFNGVSKRFERPASVVSQATRGTTAAACVLRENKRPFPLRPVSELHLLTPGEHELVDVVVEELDISAECWQPKVDLPRVQRDLSEYMSFPLGELITLERSGAHEPEIRVRSTGLATVVETRFRLSGFPNAVFCRRDVPFDELGHVCGLREMTVVLDEDINGGDLLRWLESPAGLVFL